MTDGDRRVALVTGGSRGIGLAVATALAASGHDVAVGARDADRAAAAVSQIEAAGGRGTAVALDVRDADSIQAALDGVRGTLGEPVVLVNNAGVASSAPFDKLTRADWDDALAINVVGAAFVTQACLPGMIAAGFGRIVNVASVAGLQGVAYAVHYAASKHAMLGLTRSLALEVARKGVTVNAVCPGFVDTEMTERTVEKIVATTGRSAADARKSIEAMSPQRRLIQPEEVAAAVCYLVSEAAAGVNGDAVVING